MRHTRWTMFSALAILAWPSCKTRFSSSQDGRVLDVDTSSLATTGIARIDWACSGTGKRNNQGKNSQEEYCEWTPEPVQFQGPGMGLGSDETRALDLPRACVFTTAFDQTRSFHLTQRVVGKANKYSNTKDPFWATQFNSYAFLVGGSEPDENRKRDGIIGHCVTGQSCFAPNCVPDRASDPQICMVLNSLSRRQCTLDTTHQVAPVMTAGQVPQGRMGDQIIKPQLKVASSLASTCYYAIDPKMPGDSGLNPAQERTLVVCDAAGVSNCDSLADKINVGIELKVQDKACAGGKAPAKPGATGGSSDILSLAQGQFCKVLDATPTNVRGAASGTAQVLTTIPPQTEVFVRGFLNDWASVEFEQNGKKFGGKPPAFVHKSQLINTGTGKVSCRSVP